MDPAPLTAVEGAVEDEEERERRLETARIELAAQEEFDAAVVNTNVEEAAREVVGLMSA